MLEKKIPPPPKKKCLCYQVQILVCTAKLLVLINKNEVCVSKQNISNVNFSSMRNDIIMKALLCCSECCKKYLNFQFLQGHTVCPREYQI